MQDALDTALAQGKIEADAIAKDLRAKLAWCKENAAGMSFLFPDLEKVIIKQFDDFTLLISSRIKEHKESETRKAAELIAKIDAENAAKLEAERTRIQSEEEAKAKAAQDALLAAERVKMEAEVRAKAEVERIAVVKELMRTDALDKAVEAEQASIKPASEVVIDSQPTISAFLASRDFGKEAGKIRAILVEFVKFTSTRSK